MTVYLFIQLFEQLYCLDIDTILGMGRQYQTKQRFLPSWSLYVGIEK